MKILKGSFSALSFLAICSFVSIPVQAEEFEKETYEIEMVENEECVIIDNENCIVKIENVDPNGEWGYTWNVYLENKTDTEVLFDLTDVSVNGVMCDPYWAVSVQAGMNTSDEITWETSELDLYGIDNVTVVEFTLSAYDNEDWEAGNLIYDDYVIYTQGKSSVVYVEREAEITDKVLFDTDECSMLEIGFEEDGVWGTELNLYFENKSDKDLLISFEDVYVNGELCDPYWGTVVIAGSNAYASISWMEEDLEACGIESIEDVQGTMYVYDNEDWEADAIIEKEVEISVIE